MALNDPTITMTSAIHWIAAPIRSLSRSIAAERRCSDLTRLWSLSRPGVDARLSVDAQLPNDGPADLAQSLHAVHVVR